MGDGGRSWVDAFRTALPGDAQAQAPCACWSWNAGVLGHVVVRPKFVCCWDGTGVLPAFPWGLGSGWQLGPPAGGGVCRALRCWTWTRKASPVGFLKNLFGKRFSSSAEVEVLPTGDLNWNLFSKVPCPRHTEILYVSVCFRDWILLFFGLLRTFMKMLCRRRGRKYSYYC